ncbi:MAG: carboxypeptidase-like regulatory domain-containing protein, partial [Cytophagales bacterium]
MRNSIQLLGKILLLICICLFGLDSIAQEIAANYSRETINKNRAETITTKNDEVISLDKVFDDLEKQYQVRFAYENKTIENKYIDLAKARSLTQQPTNTLDEILDEILHPLSISAKKVGDYYVAKEIKLDTPPVHELAVTPSDNKKEENDPLYIRKFPKKELRIPRSLVQKNIQGLVTNENNEPLPGVSVLVKGTTIGTATSVDGTYRISIPDEAVTLVYSSVGYIAKEIAIGNESVIDIKLMPDIQSLNEIVVTALGIKKETKSLGYATASVEPDKVTVNRSTNFIQSLQGKVAGVNISGMATGAGGSSTIRIRGQSAFAGANQPLIVVDGVPISNDR